ncbi:DIP1984 family protein [Roseofilum sp. BLCC_M91]|uniref:DIP1984 family protein n=1 Tax=Roseofilum halophilum BLCC-M91 TaxID=3022259 RepID=A0ABT7BGR5_9CYAN|nr:DIP1984 family protein [Roseofilum halophilum]MDJ1178374.1 DIP1984 family protein [Roseofilum halophilum BLCC-M91]
MKLAEALTERAALSRRLQELRDRILRNAKYQEGDTPAEAPDILLKEYDKTAKAFSKLVVKINQTNNAIQLDNGISMIEALAQRDNLKLKHSLYTRLAAEATPTFNRYSKTEIKFVSSVTVADIQKSADKLAKEYRILDGKIQQANWTNDLIE